MKIAISAGHSMDCQGAIGPSPWGLNEVDCAREVTAGVGDKLKAAGVQCEYWWDDISDDQSENLNRIVDWHNDSAFGGGSHDLDISVHFNANAVTSKKMGCEVWHYSQEALSAEVSTAMAQAMDLPDRGAKWTNSLFVISNTREPCILLEVCFVDSSADADAYRRNVDAVTTAIAEAVGNVEVGAPPPDEVDETPPPGEASGENAVIIDSMIKGDVTINVNDSLIVGHEDCEHVVDLQIRGVGDVVLVVNGEMFHGQTELEEPDGMHRDIETTTFGGASDPNNSAYPPYGYLNDTDLYVALPYSFPNDIFPINPPMVRVYHGELSAVAAVADKGPWMIDDPYVMDQTGTLRPIAETCHDEGAPLPSGPNKGEVPTNRAGLDLSPALARKVGLEGKGFCSWRFEGDVPVS